MALKVRKYNGIVESGSGIVESQTGTLSFQVMLSCEDGETSFNIWLTEKNRDRALKYFEVLGADTARLSNQPYLEYELPTAIVGKEVSFGTKEEQYNGSAKVKVSWIGKKSDPNVIRGAATFFGGKVPTPPSAPEAPITDDDIPF